VAQQLLLSYMLDAHARNVASGKAPRGIAGAVFLPGHRSTLAAAVRKGLIIQLAQEIGPGWFVLTAGGKREAEYRRDLRERRWARP